MNHRDDSIYLKHILDAISRIEKYVNRINRNRFAKHLLIQDGVIRQIEIIGEASKKLSTTFRNKHKHIPWKDIAGMRDKLIHDYFGVDIDAVWSTVEEDLPTLKREVNNILSKT